MEDVITKEVNKVSNKKACPLAFFIYHLYAQYECLTLKEVTKLRLFMEKRSDLFLGEPVLAKGISRPDERRRCGSERLYTESERINTGSRKFGASSSSKESSSPWMRSVHAYACGTGSWNGYSGLGVLQCKEDHSKARRYLY